MSAILRHGLGLVLLLAAASLSAQDSVTVTTTEGRVQYQREDLEWRALVSGRGATVSRPIVTRSDAGVTFEAAGVTLQVGPLSALRFVRVSEGVVDIELVFGHLAVTQAPPGAVVTVTLPMGSVRSEGAAFRIEEQRVSITGQEGRLTATSTLGHTRRVWPGETVLLRASRPVSVR